MSIFIVDFIVDFIGRSQTDGNGQRPIKFTIKFTMKVNRPPSATASSVAKRFIYACIHVLKRTTKINKGEEGASFKLGFSAKMNRSQTNGYMLTFSRRSYIQLISLAD